MTSIIDTPSARFTIPTTRYDVVVIGGGVNGAGTFRDLAMRGLRALLFEKDDFGAGTTGASAGMIHGGFRYILSEPTVTRDSCRDAGIIRRTASHLVFRIPFIYPMLAKRRFARGLLFGADAALFAYDMYARAKGGHPHLLFDKEEILKIEPGLSPDVIGGVSFDEWGIESNRLCYLLVRSGEMSGGKACNHARVEGIQYVPPSEGREGYFLVKINHLEDHRTERIETRTVVNAAGPWGPVVAGLAGSGYRLRPAKGVHLVLDRRITNYAIVAQAPDGRDIYIEPWENLSIIGNTDDDYYGDLDDVPVTHDEVQYLLQGIEKVFPPVRGARIISTWAGVRPTLFEYGKNEDDLTRDHRIIDHSADGLEGMWSIAGGKLAAFRMMAEEAADAVCRFLGAPTGCRTGEVPLPGSEEHVDIKSLSLHWSVDPYVLRRMVSRHGSMVRKILVYMLRMPRSRSLICRCEPVTEAEILYSIKVEKVRTMADLMRRTRFGTGPCGGSRCAFKVSALLGKQLDWDSKRIREEALSFIQYRYAKRRAVIKGTQARQEVINFMHV
ncbi:MAG: glycerol-3-phosphate dehydrogenase/oxidase [Pseudomonadota bacterium]